MKKCTKCLEIKPESDFYPNGKNRGLRPDCKACLSVRNKAWKRENKERHLLNVRAWQKLNPTKVKNSRIKRRYGVTLGQYSSMWAAQGGKCMICESRSKKLVIDHNHQTGAIRGLLCSECNSAIGFFGDRMELLNRAVAYLRGRGWMPVRNPSPSANGHRVFKP